MKKRVHWTNLTDMVLQTPHNEAVSVEIIYFQRVFHLFLFFLKQTFRKVIGAAPHFTELLRFIC